MMANSQWDFGELFPKEAGRRVLSVSQATAQVRRLVEKELGEVWVAGEITNFRLQNSGHIYFTLKDASAQLQCVLFRGELLEGRSLLKDGARVLVQGLFTVYEARGQFQLRVVDIELQGIGALQKAFERLKQKLQAEGLFAAARKRPIPRCSRRIGIVTSTSGAALKDMLHVIRRRQCSLEIILASCRVQGPNAAEEIACAIALLNEWSIESHPSRHLDLIVVTRGGGSLEDLWAFNEEVVARAIFRSRLPVISAVGHEIDFTISDFVADLRAATPSVAAELITEGVFAAAQSLARLLPEFRHRTSRRLGWARDDFRDLSQRLARVHPQAVLNERWQRLDDLGSALTRSVQHRLATLRRGSIDARARLGRVKPSHITARRRARLSEWIRRLGESRRKCWSELDRRFRQVQTRLELLSPWNVLDRGYSITTDARTGQVIRHAVAVRPGQRLKTKLQAGDLSSIAE